MLGFTPDAAAALSTGRVLLTADRAQASAGRLRFGLEQLLAGRRAWPAPAITSVEALFESQALAETLPDGMPLVRLPRASEWLLWRRAAHELVDEAPLLLPNALAEGLMRAARRAAEYGISERAIEAVGTREGRWLAEAMDRVDTAARSLDALPAHRWLPRLQELPPPARPAWLAPGRRLTPRERKAFEAWASRGWTWSAGILRDECRTGAVRSTCAPDAEVELRRAVSWLADRLRGRPEARALLVVPALATERDTVRAIACEAWLDSGFDGGALDDDAESALAESPLVQRLLTTLRLVIEDVDRRSVLEWVRGGGVRGTSEPSHARIARWLAGVLPSRVAPGVLAAALRRAPAELLEVAMPLAEALARLAQGLRGSTRGLAAWVRELASLVQPRRAAAAVNDETDEDEPARRAWGAWQQMLEDLAATDGLSPGLRARELLELLVATARVTPLPRAHADVALRLSADPGPTIVRYDFVWVAGLTAQRFPLRTSPDPFIPLELQRAAEMPGSRAGVLDSSPEQMLAGWCASGESIVLSAPARDANGEQESAPLLERFARLDSAQLIATPESRAVRRYRQAGAADVRHCWFADVRGQPWDPTQPVPGGSRAIELQSECGFRAYAEQRLGARAHDAASEGLDERERGRYLHRLMEFFWREVQDSDRLRAASPPQRAAWIARAADEADRHLREEAGPDVSQSALRRERDRAIDIFEAWLELELQRSPFRLRQSEQALEVCLWGARFRLRPDRVDELLRVEGEPADRAVPTVAIIDYKSGAPANGRWTDPRPAHPQLLLYQAALEAAQGVRVEALAVGRLRTAREGFVGQVARPNLFPKLKPSADVSDPESWDRRLAEWRTVARALTHAFLAGEARVDPREPASCQWCHLSALCRRFDEDPSRPMAEDDTDAGDPGDDD